MVKKGIQFLLVVLFCASFHFNSFARAGGGGGSHSSSGSGSHSVSSGSKSSAFSKSHGSEDTNWGQVAIIYGSAVVVGGVILWLIAKKKSNKK
ncbi:MAG: hypothetical protein HXX09_04050 [Bacteroidetes bacterium]|nr:hypothetical protein [Bacteroidota bacterium]